MYRVNSLSGVSIRLTDRELQRKLHETFGFGFIRENGSLVNTFLDPTTPSDKIVDLSFVTLLYK